MIFMTVSTADAKLTPVESGVVSARHWVSEGAGIAVTIALRTDFHNVLEFALVTKFAESCLIVFAVNVFHFLSFYLKIGMMPLYALRVLLLPIQYI